MLKKRKQLPLLVSVFFFVICLPCLVFATCSDTMMNPITDIAWYGIFPFQIGGINVIGTSIPTAPYPSGGPTCQCGNNFGITYSFWVPDRLDESVKDAFCFDTIGANLGNSSNGFSGGGVSFGSPVMGSSINTTDKSQVHHYMFPVWGIMGLFLDVPCLAENGVSFDIAYISEIDPTHQNCILGFLLNPEALLFGNPVSQMACIADSVAANTPGTVLDPVTNLLFWCAGSWGSIYPFCGYVSNPDQVEASALHAAKILYKLGRTGLMLDPGMSWCGPVPMPIWTKSHYRLQIMKPVDGQVVNIGQSGLVWGSAKNPPFNAGGNSSDNFSYVVFRKYNCCQNMATVATSILTTY